MLRQIFVLVFACLLLSGSLAFVFFTFCTSRKDSHFPLPNSCLCLPTQHFSAEIVCCCCLFCFKWKSWGECSVIASSLTKKIARNSKSTTLLFECVPLGYFQQKHREGCQKLSLRLFENTILLIRVCCRFCGFFLFSGFLAVWWVECKINSNLTHFKTVFSFIEMSKTAGNEPHYRDMHK